MEAKHARNFDVIIVGAGWSGLVAGRTYLRLKPGTSLLIIDSNNTVGGAWSKDRLYPGLVAQVSHGLFNYSDPPMARHNGDAKDPTVSGQMIHDYLDRFARDHDLIRRIRFNTFVGEAKQTPTGKWRLTMRDSLDVVETDKLLLATGVASIPFIPDLNLDQDEKLSHSIPVMHSIDLGKRYEALKAKSVRNVVVVGAAKSAYDAVYLLLRLGKKVTWVIRRDGGGPLSMLPFRVLGVIDTLGFASTRLMSHLSPSILNVKGPMYRLLQRTSAGRWCVARFWDFLDSVSRRHAGYAKGDHIAKLRPEIDRQASFWANSGLGMETTPQFWDTLHGPNLTVLRDKIDASTFEGIKLRSGTTVGADYLVMCTGWGDHFGMFDSRHKAMAGIPPRMAHSSSEHTRPRPASQPESQPRLIDDSIADDIDWESYDTMADREVDEQLPFLASPPEVGYAAALDPSQQAKWRLYRRMVPVSMAQKGDRSLVILGQIHTIQTPLVSEVQSLWAILYLIGDISLPDVHTMAREVALWNAWTRKRYLHQGHKFPYSLYDFIPYIDTMFADLGLNSRRKSNPLSEMLAPYRPQDFAGFVDEYLATRATANTNQA